MAITNFIPEIWSAKILTALRASLVYGQPGVINRDYEGDIAEAGDTVHITSFTDPTVSPYTRNSTTISYEVPDDDGESLVVDQANYFAFKVDDLDARQAKGGFVDVLSTGGAYKLAAAADTYLSGLMSAGVAPGNILGADAVDFASAPEDAYEILVALRTTLRKSETPDAGRWVVVTPEFYAALLNDDRFIRADAAGTTEGLRNGFVGRAAGFDVIEGTRVPTSGAADVIIAGHGMATTYAEQISKVEALRLETAFADGLRGLHLFGAKVIRPAQLAKIDVTVTNLPGGS